MGKIDLKDAYFSMKIHPKHKKLLKFCWRGISDPTSTRLFHLVQPQLPEFFSKIMQEAMKQLRERGIQLVQYLDDILVIDSSVTQLREHTEAMQETSSTEDSVSSETSSPYQEDDSNNTSSLPSSFSLQSSTTVEKQNILWRNKQDYSATGILDKESMEDLTWWSSHLTKQNDRVNLTIESDASTKGWGAYCQGMRAGGRGWKRINT